MATQYNSTSSDIPPITDIGVSVKGVSPGGYTHMSEIYGYVPLWRPPFSGSSAAPETHLFTPSVSSYALRFPFFEKFSILGLLLSDFGKISAPNTLILAKICSQDPSFLRKNPFCRPYF